MLAKMLIWARLAACGAVLVNAVLWLLNLPTPIDTVPMLMATTLAVLLATLPIIFPWARR